jgi:hypothetical protein
VVRFHSQNDQVIPKENASETRQESNQIVGLFPKSGGSRLPVPRGGRLRFESLGRSIPYVPGGGGGVVRPLSPPHGATIQVPSRARTEVVPLPCGSTMSGVPSSSAQHSYATRSFVPPIATNSPIRSGILPCCS